MCEPRGHHATLSNTEKDKWYLISHKKKSRNQKQVVVDRARTGRVGEFWLPGAGRVGEMKRCQSKGIKLKLWKSNVQA